MSIEPSDILVIQEPISREDLAVLAGAYFEDMVKYVVDLRLGLAAVGGELHADAEEALLARGSQQADLWGANYYPGKGEDACIEYTSMINIRPAAGNRGMEIFDPTLREQIRELTFRLIGRGEPLP